MSTECRMFHEFLPHLIYGMNDLSFFIYFHLKFIQLFYLVFHIITSFITICASFLFFSSVSHLSLLLLLLFLYYICTCCVNKTKYCHVSFFILLFLFCYFLDLYICWIFLDCFVNFWQIFFVHFLPICGHFLLICNQLFCYYLQLLYYM